MEGIIVIAILWFVINALTKGMKASPPSQPPGRARPRPPLTPTARPAAGMPDWGELMTMLGGEAQPPAAEGEPAEAPPSDGLGPILPMEGGLSMPEGGIMEGAPMLEAVPGHEGAPLPGYEGLDAAPPIPEVSAAMPRSEAPLRNCDPAAMRNAVVWAEILARPKSLRRFAR